VDYGQETFLAAIVLSKSGMMLSKMKLYY